MPNRSQFRGKFIGVRVTEADYGCCLAAKVEPSVGGVGRYFLTNQGAIQNVKDFVASIQSGKLINNAETAVESNLTAILGRTAAYQGAIVT